MIARQAPKLRFPEFRDEWVKKKMGEVFDITAGGDIEKLDFSKTSDTFHEYPVFANALTADGLVGYSTKPKITKSAVTVTGRGDIGHAKARKANFSPVVRLLTLVPKETQSTYFFECAINRSPIYIESTGVPQLTAPQLSSYELYITDTEEQEKIADFLTAVDGKIEVMQKRVELLEKYKKGVMQDIFSQKIRFKDENGKDFPKWEEKKLGEIARIYQPEYLSQTLLATSGYPVYGANGIIGFYDKYNHEKSQIAVTCRGNTCGKVNLTMPKSWITSNAMVINTDKESSSINKLFMYYELRNTDLSYLITGSGQPQITGDVKFHRIKVPCIDEQQKIADFLTSLDDKIELENKKLEQVKLFKKALLQEMFV